MKKLYQCVAVLSLLGCLVMASACAAGVSGGSAVLFPKKMTSTVLGSVDDGLWTIALVPGASGAHYLNLQSITGTKMLRHGIDGSTNPTVDGWNGVAWSNVYTITTYDQVVDFAAWPKVAGSLLSDDDSATLTVSGCTSSPTAAARFRRVGVLVIAVIDDAVSCTSGNTSLYLASIPTAFRPTSEQRTPLVECTDNGADVNDCAVVVTGSQVKFERAGGFTASGTKGTPANLTFTYSTEF